MTNTERAMTRRFTTESVGDNLMEPAGALFFHRIRQDLDQVTLNTPFGGDQARLARTQYELDELQEKLSRGFYDEQELDEVMGALQVVIGANRLRSGDRDILTDDLTRMRDFRIRHDRYGAR
jgi:hypothetical protein